MSLKRIVLLCVVLVVGAAATWFVFAVRDAREEARCISCMCPLKQLALAMHNYHQYYGCFPPAYIPDKNGKPMHSWRILVMPFIEGETVGKEYRFDEPWNSPHNRKITDEAMATKMFQCPSQPQTGKPTTNYMMIVGPHTISDGPHGRKIAEITDALDNTIMLVEVADSDVYWAEPKDLDFDRIDFKINGLKRPGLSSYHPKGVNVAFCDGGLGTLPNSTLPEQIRAMATIDGGEPLPPRP
jgi:prepilin-type processing-associated H-X9-DG protein